jgi:hypothetical protein
VPVTLVAKLAKVVDVEPVPPLDVCKTPDEFEPGAKLPRFRGRPIFILF